MPLTSRVVAFRNDSPPSADQVPMSASANAAPRAAAAVVPPNIGDLYREHAATVARWAARLGGPLIEVEDVLQEVFVIAHRQLPTFRGDARVSTWLFAITRNVVRQKRERERVRRLLLSHFTGPAPVLAPTQADDVERRESLALVYRALARLPEKHRTAFVLFEIEGLSGEEAAELTGTKVSTMRVWLMRARAQFAKQMSRLLAEEGR